MAFGPESGMEQVAAVQLLAVLTGTSCALRKGLTRMARLAARAMAAKGEVIILAGRRWRGLDAHAAGGAGVDDGGLGHDERAW